MKIMFIEKPEGEVTQVDFWNMYKDAFTPFADQYQLLVASDVIKNVNNVFPQAQAMVVTDPVQRFVVRGVDRRKDILSSDQYRCHWDRSQCPAEPFASLGELYDHVLQHLSSADSPELPCLWSTCPRPTHSKLALTSHVLTHVSSTHPTTKHPTQSDTITLPTASHPFPTSDPTSRPPPPPRNTTLSYEIPILDPPSISLTALLVIRILFRTSFASADAAPRVDADHFGFPGIVEETEDAENADLADRGAEGDEREGERRGRKAFVGIRKYLEGVRIRDEALMGWVTEMIDEEVIESPP
jgi:chromatin structure-remodeling complex subunit RSC9